MTFLTLFFFSQLVYTMYCLWTHKFHFSTTFSLKMSPTVLFTHLKIILLQYFLFSFFNCIQTDPNKCLESTFARLHFPLSAFFTSSFFSQLQVVDQVFRKQCIYVLFIGPTNFTFQSLFH